MIPATVAATSSGSPSVNKLDRLGADFYRVVDQIKNILGAKPLVMVLPIGTEAEFVGIVDLLTRQAYVWDDSGQPENFEVQEVPEDMKELVEKHRFELIETAVEQDDDAMEQYLEGTEPDLATIKKCIRKGTRDLAFFPTYCGSAFKNKGIQQVLNAVVDYLPDPTEVPPQPEIDLEGHETGNFALVDPSGPVRALAFKIMEDRFGALTFTRIYSGTINKGDTLVNTSPSGFAVRHQCRRTIVFALLCMMRLMLPPGRCRSSAGRQSGQRS